MRTFNRAALQGFNGNLVSPLSLVSQNRVIKTNPSGSATTKELCQQHPSPPHSTQLCIRPLSHLQRYRFHLLTDFIGI